jgi:hypothetical protein
MIMNTQCYFMLIRFFTPKSHKGDLAAHKLS